MKPLPPKRRLEVSLHEAAHAVVAHALGYTVNGLQLIDNTAARQHGLAFVQQPKRRPIDPLREAIINLAGEQSELGGVGVEPVMPRGTDRSHTETMPCFAGVKIGLRGLSFLIAGTAALGLVNQHWSSIRTVGYALNDSPRGRLSGRAFRKIVGIEKGCAG